MTLTRQAPAPSTTEPALPAPRGPLSAAVLDALRTGGRPGGALDAVPDDVYGEDAQLTLYCLYELHYRGFAGVDPEREWDPELLTVRRDLERAFLARLREDAPVDDVRGPADVDAEMAGLLTEPTDADGTGVSHHLLRDGEPWQFREYLAHRSMYHLKEADPQAWVIPRLHGAAKAALVTVEHDEYGSGDPERVHARLFAAMMRAAGLDDGYGAYLDLAPAETLAEVTLMSMFGLHRALRGALVGQFAAVELTSSPGSDRLVRAIARMGLGPEVAEFYAEHVEADAVHEQLVRRGVIRPLLAAEPELAADVVFGVRASSFLAERLERRLLGAWGARATSLREPLPPIG
ncbi:iron-containing redox enzyme family protein [Pseudonocardia humida]|uniref:Iron-containing redox enzyme family protein n=1 Tax=Pseudonocardia humida TaxID=2800819 RepID=A0ABT0ZYD0_9PSEU|nr:iron-containing redox enzyme family protein [Pseudonocardia humida]MCO1655752.1 iron-containing redox enzyme family protein [Pseudonocardia humida]